MRVGSDHPYRQHENILCAILALLKELDRNGLEFVVKDCNKRIAKMKNNETNLWMSFKFRTNASYHSLTLHSLKLTSIFSDGRLRHHYSSLQRFPFVVPAFFSSLFLPVPLIPISLDAFMGRSSRQRHGSQSLFAQGDRVFASLWCTLDRLCRREIWAWWLSATCESRALRFASLRQTLSWTFRCA